MCQEEHSIRRLVAWLITILGIVILVGGVVVALRGLGAETTFKLFGQEFASTSVGVSIVFIGAVTLVLIFRRVLPRPPVTQGTILAKGNVYANGNPIKGAIVFVEGSAFRRETTDDDGFFHIHLDKEQNTWIVIATTNGRTTNKVISSKEIKDPIRLTFDAEALPNTTANAESVRLANLLAKAKEIQKLSKFSC